MNRRLVVSDAGPLIALARIEELSLLQRLFVRVYITPTVQDEILPHSAYPESGVLGAAIAEGWIEVASPPDEAPKPMNPGVDAGEASAIQLASCWQKAGDAVLLLVDDRAGRMEARSLGIPVIGTAAVIGVAKSEGLIPAAKPL